MSLEVGQRLGGFELERRLGEGAFAEVWLARLHGSLGFSRRVAVKILKPDREADPKHLRDLLAEAALCAELRHPNIVEVYSVDEVGDTVLVSMEPVMGGSLLGLLRRLQTAKLRMPRSAVLDVGIQLCTGLDHAWNGLRDSGEPFRLIHRDLKPANLLITRHGTLKIADFGLAKRMGDPTQTATGTLKGTPCYVAPESLRGERDFRPSVDLFAVGCILSELWTGSVLYAADTLPAVVTRILMGNPTQDAAPMRRDFPELAEIVEEMLRRDSRARPQDPSTVRDRLVFLRELAGADPGLDVLHRLVSQVAAGEQVELGRPPTSDSDWIRLWRRVDPRLVESTTGMAPTPLLETAAFDGLAGVAQPRESSPGRAPLAPVPPRRPATTEIPETQDVSVGIQSMEPPTSPRPRRRRVRAKDEVGTTRLMASQGQGPRPLLWAVGLLVLAGVTIAVLLPRHQSVAGAMKTSAAPETGQGEPPDLEGLTGSSLMQGALVVPPNPESTPAPGPEPTPAPAPTISTEPTPAPESESTPEPPTEPEPVPAEEPLPVPPTESVAARANGCLLVSSNPVGAAVTLGGRPLGVNAGRASAPRSAESKPMTATIEMVDLGTPSRQAVRLLAGQTVHVHCELDRSSCTTRVLDSWGCD